MSLIYRKYKYNRSFKVEETFLSALSNPNNHTDPQSFQRFSKGSPSSRTLVPFDLAKNTSPYFAQDDIPLYPPKKLSLPHQHKRSSPEISISLLYQSGSSHKELPHPFPISPHKKINIPKLRIEEPVLTERAEISSSRNKVSQIIKSARGTEYKKASLEDYLSSLDRRKATQVESRIKGLIEFDMNSRTSSIQRLSALDMNNQVLHSLLPRTLTEVDGKKKNKKRKSGLKKRMSQLHSEASEITSSVVDSRASSSKLDVLQKLNRNHQETPNNVKRDSILLVRPKHKRSVELNVSENRVMMKELANNLHELHLQHKNEKQFVKVISMLAEDNPEVLKLVLSHHHKISDYDPVRLEQKFAMIEFGYEHVPIPLRLQKKRAGISLTENSTFAQLEVFNQRMEEFLMKRRFENLEAVRSSLEDTQQKIMNYEVRRVHQLAKEMKIQESLPKSSREHVERLFPNSPVCFDSQRTVEDIQRDLGSYRHVKPKNLTFARFVDSIYNEWKHSE